ncbi:DUF6095 family protein [Tenacibaculum sp. UWU-22]|uniref:DUF6095 family protein n=1 Tax=Tenacibaculum sp. UWU-22 TaxID=3234187 RepID=UPI0034DB66C6
MEENNKYKKPFIKILILIGLLILSPIILSLGYRANEIFIEKPKIYIAYFLLIIGFSLVIYTVYFGFKTIKTLLEALFNK